MISKFFKEDEPKKFKQVEFEIKTEVPKSESLPKSNGKRFTIERGIEFDLVLPNQPSGNTNQLETPTGNTHSLRLSEQEIQLMSEQRLKQKIGQEVKLHWILGKTIAQLNAEKHNSKGYSRSNIRKYYLIFERCGSSPLPLV
jgi:hypothetical protein